MTRKRVTALVMVLITLFGVSLTAAASSQIVNLVGGDTLEVNCDGRRMSVNQNGGTKLTVECKGNQTAPTATPTDPATPAPDPSELSVVKFMLINADNDQDLLEIGEGTVIDLGSLPTRNFNIRADTNPNVVGSLKFGLNDNADYRVENIAPYAIAGDDNGDYHAWSLPTGTYKLTAIAYSDNNSGGQASPVYTVNFEVMSSASTPDPISSPTAPAPGDTPTPVPTSQPPTSSVPLCTDHDPTKWHPLYDAEKHCHYDHTHNANPADVNSIFGPVAEPYGGQEISYPWQTPNENEVKHEGYKYAVGVKDKCEAEGYEYMGQVNCVRAFRIEHHVIGGARGANVRLHSYWSEVQVCTPDRSKCGIIKTGGWGDFGILHVPYKTNIIPLPADPSPVNQSIHQDPYRGHNSIDIAMEAAKWGNDNKTIWTTDGRYGYNQLTNFFFRVLDDWGGINPNDPTQLHLICPDFQCKYNNSEHHVFTVRVEIPAELDTDRDGFVTYSGYTDRAGNIINNCGSLGVDCIPLEIVNAPVGTGIWSRNLSGPRPAGEVIPDFDTSPPGEYWIEYPN